jgi:hypothetical protein
LIHSSLERGVPLLIYIVKPFGQKLVLARSSAAVLRCDRILISELWRSLNDAGAATDGTRALSRPSAFLAFFGEKSLKSFSCPLAFNTRDNLFSAAAKAFIHWNSPIFPSSSGSRTMLMAMRRASSFVDRKWLSGG